jgi:hypothetical protein
MTLSNLIQPVLAAAPILMEMMSILLILTAGSVLIIMFKPMLLGIWRASKLYVKQYLSQERQHSRAKHKNLQSIYQAANDLEISSPSAAAEIRSLSARI